MKIGIYGGTFNPPHLGHMAAAGTAAAVLELDKLILIPAAEPPHKQLPEGSATAKQRFDMVRLMADNLNLPGIVEVSSMELERQGKSYTADTLRMIREQYPEDELWLLMGTDMFLTLQYWREPETIMELAGICAFGRTEKDGEELFAPQRAFLQERYNARLTTITLPGLVDISSSDLRVLLEKGEGREYLADPVYGYILMNGLYHLQVDLKQLDLPELRACSYSMVRAKRIPHIRGTEEEAVRLAQRWGADETLARRAAILHDCTKYLELDEQLALCAKYGVELDELEQRAVKLLHSKTGACIAKYIFGEPEQVYQAIFWHTTGKAEMSLLEKVIYLADYIEPTRDFDGVEPLRKLAYDDLDAALLMGMNMTIEEMEQRGVPVHKNTLAARNWLLPGKD
ncbi:MAG: nicotinate (nicotinamide) nucleotide adenylyltransferase [Oscillospiraceae bacterium]|nr:nicotinate (nicotinamide) nucleotide adenylyltransferase [Oscillospiraceae bacterium]